MSRGAGALSSSGGASVSREPGPREAGLRPLASRSRLPERTLYGAVTLMWFVEEMNEETPVATGEGHRTLTARSIGFVGPFGGVT
jgi:hypothetical protein